MKPAYALLALLSAWGCLSRALHGDWAMVVVNVLSLFLWCSIYNRTA